METEAALQRLEVIQ